MESISDPSQMELPSARNLRWTPSQICICDGLYHRATIVDGSLICDEVHHRWKLHLRWTSSQMRDPSAMVALRWKPSQRFFEKKKGKEEEEDHHRGFLRKKKQRRRRRIWVNKFWVWLMMKKSLGGNLVDDDSGLKKIWN
ncbi:hypothetical protein ACOSP7_014692 [Xanthoceras sorbifolium]